MVKPDSGVEDSNSGTLAGKAFRPRNVSADDPDALGHLGRFKLRGHIRVRAAVEVVYPLNKAVLTIE